MLELGVGADIVRGIGALLWGSLAIALLVALFKPKTIQGKAISTLLVLIVFIGPIIPRAFHAYEQKQRYEKAKTLFHERCKTAGEKIYRTVEDVEGVYLINSRPDKSIAVPHETKDPAGDAARGIGYIESFLSGYVNEIAQTARHTKGAYRFVESVDTDDQQAYQYVGTPTPRQFSPDTYDLKIERKLTSPAERKAKYGIVWEEISTTEDRQFWIAGSSIKIIELSTNEVLAARIGYVMDSEQGNTNGARNPWAFAAYQACPAFPRLHGQYPHQWALTRNFAFKVIKPIQGK